MNRYIFYSWQSNLPNRDNRNFIETCIKKGIKRTSTDTFSINYSLDKDTNNEFGSPDIANTIFTKIDSSTFFIADISLINNYSPNPNVLLELGYAIAKLSWERVICIFNLKYGKLEQLPFDLRSHRVLTYNSDNVSDKEKITQIIADTINNSSLLVDAQISSNILNKQKLDRNLTYILNSLNLILGYEKYEFSSIFENDEDVLENKLARRKLLGFYIFKNYDNILSELERFSSSTQVFFSERSVKLLITNLIFSIKSFVHFCSIRQSPTLFINTDEKEESYKVIHSSQLSSSNKDGFILMKIKDINKSEVIDYGNIQTTMQVSNSTNYFILNEDYVSSFIREIVDIVNIIKSYLVQFDEILDIDVMKDFDIKKKEDIEKIIPYNKNILISPVTKELDLNLLEHFPYDDIIIYNIYFHLMRAGTVFNNQNDTDFIIKTFFKNEYILDKKTIQVVDHDVISKEEYTELIENSFYLLQSIILPNSLMNYFRYLQESNTSINKYMKDICSVIEYNIFELLPSLIQEDISHHYIDYLTNNLHTKEMIMAISKKFYLSFKSYEYSFNLFKIYLKELQFDK
ncbi:hypothetical protein RU86_GL002291 [Lactococcus piscium]|uniref:CD-NTase-associated protein 12/Pycsar effector protein TIR domain-containing protein n=1 Tax=Pseudolactococcus piscium TaxID=1364 RepID=A0A2A5S0C3_9LACT|nr:hypothetical protein [Lactococcus piscium]PCS06848.1 hypothetical protein RU86_GL002291 [Lactococcus piscium]